MDEIVVSPSVRRKPSLVGVLRVGGIGALIGGLVGSGVLAGLLSGGFRQFTLVNLQLGVMFGGTVGAIAGAVLAPLLGWVVLRPVPLGRALMWCAVGTVIVSVASATVAPLALWAPTYGGVLGLMLGSVAARLDTERRRKALREGS
jgi:hypothetical protein